MKKFSLPFSLEGIFISEKKLEKKLEQKKFLDKVSTLSQELEKNLSWVPFAETRMSQVNKFFVIVALTYTEFHSLIEERKESKTDLKQLKRKEKKFLSDFTNLMAIIKRSELEKKNRSYFFLVVGKTKLMKSKYMTLQRINEEFFGKNKNISKIDLKKTSATN